MAYVQTDEGKKECKELFPDDTQQNFCRTAALLLGHYVDWTGEGSKKKYEKLTGKLGHPETRKKNTKNYGYYVKKAKESLDKRAVDLDLALPQLQAPTSNNDVSNLSLSLSLHLLVSRFNIISHPQTSPLLPFNVRSSPPQMLLQPLLQSLPVMTLHLLMLMLSLSPPSVVPLQVAKKLLSNLILSTKQQLAKKSMMSSLTNWRT